MKEPIKDSKNVFKDFIKIFLLPTIINKSFMVYFGLNYSNYPGQGYGYGLIVTIGVFIFTIGSFLWKYRGIEDP